MKQQLCDKLAELSRAKNILGLRVTKTDNAISIDEERQLEELFDKFNMTDCNPAGREPATAEDDESTKGEGERDKMKVVPFQELMRRSLQLA